MADVLLACHKRCSKCKRVKSVIHFPLRFDRGPGARTARCKVCRNEVKREYHQTPDGRRARADYSKRWRDANLEHVRRYAHELNLRKTYGLTGEQYSEMLGRQRGCCAICREPPPANKRLSVDHCHATGTVRGLLCTNCNLGIGKLGDTAEAIERALNYLKTA